MNSSSASLPDEIEASHATGTGNHLNSESKSWNKIINKEEAVPLVCPVSPNIDSFVEEISPSQTQRTYFRQNGTHGRKKMRLDEDECDSIEIGTQDTNDDCEAFCKFVAMQLRQMTKMQKTMAQRLISEICFRGELQILQMNTVLVNNAPVYQQHQSQCMHTPRPPHLSQTFGRGQDYVLVHQQAFRHVNPVSSIPATPYQNFVQQQPDNSGVSINHLESYNSN